MSPRVKQNSNFYIIGLLLVAVFFVSALLFVWHYQIKKSDSAKAVTGVTLNSGTTQVSDTTTITSQVSGIGSDTVAYDWRVDADGPGGGSSNSIEWVNFPFNSGTTQINFGGNGGNGSINGGVVFHDANSGNCQVGSCLQFNGSNSYVSTTSVIGFTMAISFWLNTSTNSQSIMDGGPGFKTWRVEIDGSGFIKFQHWDNFNSAYRSVTGTTNVADGAWHHVVVESSIPNKSLKVYVDGSLENTFVDVAGSWAGSASGAPKFGLSNTQNLPGPLFYTGYLDEVIAFSVELDPAVVTELYNNGLAGQGGPQDIHFNQTSNFEIYDLTATGISQTGVVGSSVASSNTVTVGMLPFSLTPDQNAVNVSASSNVVIVFNESLNTGTVNQTNLPVFGSGPLLGGSYSFSTTNVSNDTVTFNPTNDFELGQNIEVIVTSNVQSTTPLAVAPFVSNFTVEATSGTALFRDSGQSLGAGDTYAMALGDIDGDGDLDLIEGNESNEANLVYTNDGAGTFTDSAQSLGAGRTESLALADVDSDSDLDLVVGNYNSPNKVYTNDGSGTFSDSGQSLGSALTNGIAVGDIDGDGDLDFVEGISGSSANKVYVNNGSGTFSDSGQSLGADTTGDVALADIDNDGDLDFLDANYYDPNRVYLNDGSGMFTDSGQTLFTVSGSVTLAVGDVDSDGDADIVYGDRDGSNKVFTNNGSGIFTDSGQSLGSNDTWSVNLADLDGDGDLDIIAGNRNTEANKIYVNNGAGTFTVTSQSLGSSDTRSEIAVGDIDGDGDLDFVTPNFSSQPNKVWINDNIPQITIVQPNGGETLTPGTFTDIIWTATDDSGVVSTIDLEYQVNPFFDVPGGSGISTNGTTTYPFSLKWGSAGSGSGEFQSLYGVRTDPFGNIFTTEFSGNRVQKFDSSGNFLFQFGSPGSGNGQFIGPTDIAIDSAGNIYTVEFTNRRIQKFDSTGAFLLKWGTSGSGDGQFTDPISIAVDSNSDVYVNDRGNSRIQKFDSSGNFITKWGSSGSGDGQFSNADGLAIDSSDNVYVADLGNNRIQKFDSSGTFVAKWGSGGSGNGQFSVLRRVAVDGQDNIFATDQGNDRIQKFDSSGTYITQWGSPGSGDGQFTSAYGITADQFGNVYVGDNGSSQIQKFSPGGTFSWLVPGDETTNGLIRGTATDGNANTAQDTSDATFTIEAPVCTASPANLVSWWPGDADANDIQDGNSGTLQNGASTSAGRVSDAFDVDGIDDGVLISDAANLNPTTELTLGAWAYPRSFPNPTQFIISKILTNGFIQYLIGVTSGGAAHCNFRIAGSTVFLTNGNVPLNQWSHISCTYDGSNLRLYLNGVEVDSTSVSGALTVDNNDVFIGRETLSTTRSFDGLIDEVQLFSRALAPAEIQSIYGAGTAGVCKQQGGTSVQRLQQPQPVVPVAPSVLNGEAISADTIRWNFTDNASNETGFKLLQGGEVITSVEEANLIFIEESGLTANTEYSGRTVLAFNANGDSSPSAEFDSVVTLMPDVTPKVLSAGTHSVTVGVEQEIPNLDTDQSGLNFELMRTGATAAQTMESGWIQEGSHTFEGLEPNQEFQVRVQARNQEGIETEFSPFSEPQSTPEDDVVDFSINLAITQPNGEPVPSPLDPMQSLSTTIELTNTGNIEATNVFVNTLVPDYIAYTRGSLFVDGVVQTDAPDEDFGQAGKTAISAIWPSVQPVESHQITFQFGFDVAALQELREQVRASANPSITFAASISSSELLSEISSGTVVLQPDLNLLPEKEEVPKPPTEEIVQIIEEVLETEYGILPPPTPTGPPPPTTTKLEDEQFEVAVGESLILTGMVTGINGEVSFQGTTSVPFTVVTLIINDGVTVIAVSDANGAWETSVSSDQLGIRPGETVDITVDAIAANASIRSERVRIGEITLKRELPEAFVSADLMTSARQISRQASEVLRENEEEVQATLAVAAPVIIISSAPLLGYLPYLPTLLYHFITYVVGLFGVRKRKLHFYGIVYNSINKQPLSLAIIRVFDKESGKLVTTKVTDRQGRYDLLLSAGNYEFKVVKPQYSFPSRIVKEDADGEYLHIYQPEEGITVEENVTIPDIPLDPVNEKAVLSRARTLKRMVLAIQSVGSHLASPLLIVGSVFSAALVVTLPLNPINWLVAFIYIIMLIGQLRLRPAAEKTWGVVFEAGSNQPVPLASIQLIDQEFGKVVKSRLSDYDGRYSFLSGPGRYRLKAYKTGYEQADLTDELPRSREVITGDVVIREDGEHIKGDIAMKVSQDSLV